MGVVVKLAQTRQVRKFTKRLKQKNKRLMLRIKFKPGIYKNKDGTFTLVRRDGTSAIYSLYHIQHFLKQGMEEGNPKIDKNTFPDFMKIHY